MPHLTKGKKKPIRLMNKRMGFSWFGDINT